MKNIMFISCLAAVLMLSACCLSSHNTDCNGRQQVKAVYGSDDGGQLTACFDQANGQVTIQLPDGDPVTLPQTVSASGSRYAADKLEFWEHQGKGYYFVDGKLLFEGTVKK